MMDLQTVRSTCSRSRICRMWCPYHIPRPAADAIRAVVVLLALIANSETALAQPAEGPEADPAAPFVDFSHAMAAHDLVEKWVQAGKVLGQRPEPILVDRALGIRISLRVQGHALGTGDAWRDDLEQVLEANDGAGPIDLTPLIEKAAFTAFGDSRRRLNDAARDAFLMARLRPELRGAGNVPELDELANTITVDIQIAHHPQAITIGPGEPHEAVLSRFVPGYHGLVSRWRLGQAPPLEAGDNPDAPPKRVVIWPATALAQNAAPTSQARRLAAHLPGLKFHEIDRLGRPGGPALLRFEVVHVTRPQPGLRAVDLVRGGVLMRRADLGNERLDDMAERMATHLHRFYIGNGLVRGTYHPSTDRFEPELAELSEATLGAAALAHHLRTQGKLRLFDPNAGNITQRLEDLMQRAALDLDADEDPLILTPDTAGLLLLTRLDLRDGRPDPIGLRFAAALRESLAAETGQPSRAAAAIAALALGRHALAAGNDDDLAATAALLNSLWERGAARDINAMPWMALNAATLEPALVAAGLLDAETLQQHRAALGQMADQLEDFQIIENPDVGPPDVVGGFVIPTNPPAPADAPPAPTWSTAPMLSYLATTMRLDEAGTRDPFGRIITAQYAARFLGQLMIDTPNCYYVRAPEQAVGGVRSALFDSRLSIAPTAMSLIAINEFRLTLDERARQLEEPDKNRQNDPEALPTRTP